MDLRTNTPISGRLNRCSNAETREEERKKRHTRRFTQCSRTHTHTYTCGDLRQWAAIKVINGHESFTILILSSCIRNNKVLLRSLDSPSSPCSFHFVYLSPSPPLPSRSSFNGTFLISLESSNFTNLSWRGQEKLFFKYYSVNSGFRHRIKVCNKESSMLSFFIFFLL